MVVMETVSGEGPDRHNLVEVKLVLTEKFNI